MYTKIRFRLVLAAFIISALVVLGGVIVYRDLSTSSSGVAVGPANVYRSTVTNASGNTMPSLLTIPKLGVKATVESVGVDKAGDMAVPKGWGNVGWYKYGGVPGAPGSVAIDGHIDNARGAKGVFYNLKNLTVGDVITVTNGRGQAFRYKVTKMATYDVGAFPSRDVFGTTTARSLALITCDGAWNQKQKMYDKRFVVYAALDESGA